MEYSGEVPKNPLGEKMLPSGGGAGQRPNITRIKEQELRFSDTHKSY